MPAVQEQTSAQIITEIGMQFPTLRGWFNEHSWNSIGFASWASLQDCDALVHAASFLLSVWNAGTPDGGGWWNHEPHHLPQFDPVKALGDWDYQHTAAFVGWCLKPRWP